MKNIIREGHKSLTLEAKDVKIPLSKQDRQLALDLLDYVKNSQDDEIAQEYQLRPAVGLAAPQMNVLKKMFAVHVTDFDGMQYSYILINPKITHKSKSLIYLPGGEGCLSVDRITEGMTPRYEWVEFETHVLDVPSGLVMPITLKVEGYVGIVFQHEYDHLHGVLYTSKLFDELPNAKPAFEIETTCDSLEQQLD
jgi:peptide deformylase